MLKLSLWDYSHAYIFGNRTMTIIGEDADAGATEENEREKGVIFKNWAPFTDCITERSNNTHVDNA